VPGEADRVAHRVADNVARQLADRIAHDADHRVSLSFRNGEKCLPR
jgi:hypothetical protein